MKKTSISFFIIFLFFLVKRTEAQSLIADSAFIITIYSLNKASSNDSFYSVNICQVITFIGQNKSGKRLEELLLNGNRKKWSEKKWLKKLRINKWLPFVNKLPVTSYTVQNVIRSDLRNKLVKYDSMNRYVTGASVNMLTNFSDISFIKAYKVYCEGYIDTTSKMELNSIYHGINKSSLVYHSTVSSLRKNGGDKEVTTLNTPITIEVKINHLLFDRYPLFFFIEMKGSVIEEYRVLKTD